MPYEKDVRFAVQPEAYGVRGELAGFYPVTSTVTLRANQVCTVTMYTEVDVEYVRKIAVP